MPSFASLRRKSKICCCGTARSRHEAAPGRKGGCWQAQEHRQRQLKGLRQARCARQPAARQEAQEGSSAVWHCRQRHTRSSSTRPCLCHVLLELGGFVGADAHFPHKRDKHSVAYSAVLLPAGQAHAPPPATSDAGGSDVDVSEDDLDFVNQYGSRLGFLSALDDKQLKQCVQRILYNGWFLRH